MLPKEPKRFSRENGQDWGNSLNAPHLSHWLNGPWDDQPSYLCSFNHRWSTYCGTCVVSGHPLTWLVELRWNKDALSQIFKKPGYGSYGIWLLLPLHFPFLPSPLQTGPGRAAGRRADGGSWPWPQTVLTLSGWAAALSDPLWLVLALLFHDRFRN